MELHSSNHCTCIVLGTWVNIVFPICLRAITLGSTLYFGTIWEHIQGCIPASSAFPVLLSNSDLLKTVLCFYWCSSGSLLVEGFIFYFLLSNDKFTRCDLTFSASWQELFPCCRSLGTLLYLTEVRFSIHSWPCCLSCVIGRVCKNAHITGMAYLYLLLFPRWSFHWKDLQTWNDQSFQHLGSIIPCRALKHISWPKLPFVNIFYLSCVSYSWELGENVKAS